MNEELRRNSDLYRDRIDRFFDCGETERVSKDARFIARAILWGCSTIAESIDRTGSEEMTLGDCILDLESCLNDIHDAINHVE